MENTATSIGRSLPISTKHSVEICNFIRHKNTEKCKKLLEGVIEGKVAVPFRRYNKNIGHRRGKMASGRYPKKASIYILRLIESAEANAKNLGLTSPLVIEEIIANKGVRGFHFGRIRRIKNKMTHIKLVVKEAKEKLAKAETEAKKSLSEKALEDKKTKAEKK